MKSALVGSLAERRRRIESGEDIVVGVNKFADHRAQPAAGRPRRRDHGRRPGVESAAQEAVTEWRAERDQDARRQGARRAARGRRHRHQPDGRHPRLRPRRRDDGGVGRGSPRGVRRVPGAHRRGRARAPAARPTRRLTDVRERVPRHRRGARRPAALPGRQAGPGRALQRRRADRRPRPRRRLRGGLPGHPAHPGADRVGRGGGGRRTSSGCRSCPARTCRWSRRSSRACARPALDDVPVVVGGIIPKATPDGCASRAWPRSSRPRTSALTEIMGEIVDVVRAGERTRRRQGAGAGLTGASAMSDGAPGSNATATSSGSR